MDKVQSKDDLRAWLARTEKLYAQYMEHIPPLPPLRYAVEYKLDGLTINLTYENGSACTGRDARQRRGRRGHLAAGAHHPRRTAVHPLPGIARGAGRVHHAAEHAGSIQQDRGGAAEKRAQRRRGRDPQPRPRRDRRPQARRVFLPGGHDRKPALRRSRGHDRVPEAKRLPHPSADGGRIGRSAGAGRGRRGSAARDARFPDRRRGDQGARSAHARADGQHRQVPPLGGGVQVCRRGGCGNAFGRYLAARAHGQADAAGAPDSHGHRRRDRAARDAQQLRRYPAQEGRHRLQGVDPPQQRRDSRGDGARGRGDARTKRKSCRPRTAPRAARSFWSAARTFSA